MKEYHCTICVQSKPVDQFTKWTADKRKSRRCDSCQDDPEIEKRIEKSKREAELAANKKPPVNTPSDEDKRTTRDKLADYIAQKEIDDFVGDK